MVEAGHEQEREKSDATDMKRMMASLRQQSTPEDAAAEHIGWCDYTLDARHWFSLFDLEPIKAAMLLCGYNPNKTQAAQLARLSTSDGLTPQGFLRLLQRFEDLAKSVPQPRSLLQWLGTARVMKLRYAPWIDQYAHAAGLAVDDVTASMSAPARLVVEDTTVALKPVPAAGSPAVEPKQGLVSGTLRRWTPELLEKLRAVRAEHGTKKAAEWAIVSESRVRRLLPKGEPATKGYSAFTHRTK